MRFMNLADFQFIERYKTQDYIWMDEVGRSARIYVIKKSQLAKIKHDIGSCETFNDI